MSIPLRSKTSTHGRNMAGARALWRATGMTDQDFNKPIIAVANSFTQFVPGHVHLKDIGQLVCKTIEENGGVAKEFNTIAVDDGIAMGHSGMLYSLPSREIIADSVEYMVNAHCADALVCISNCDKITPGMLLAAIRLNIPTVFVSGGTAEAGKNLPADAIIGGETTKGDLVTAMSAAASNLSDDALKKVEKLACPTCGSCSGMFTANSMNCLTEALGLSLPGNGSTLATHIYRKDLFINAGKTIVELCKKYYEQENTDILPLSILSRDAMLNAMKLDMAMGGSTNTVLHMLAMAFEGNIDFTLKDIDSLSKTTPCLAKISPNSTKYHMEDVHRAGGVPALLGELNRAGLLSHNVTSVHTDSLEEWLQTWDIRNPNASDEAKKLFSAAPGNKPTALAFSTSNLWTAPDDDNKNGCIRSVENAYTKDGGLAVLYGNLATEGAIIKTAGIDPELFHFEGTAYVTESQDEAVEAILSKKIKAGDFLVVRYEGPSGGPGMQEMLYPTSFIKGIGLGKVCALITDGRFSGGSSGISIGHVSPEAAAGGTIGLVETGDKIILDIDSRSIHLQVSDEELAKRRQKQLERSNPWKPKNRERKISNALKLYSLTATSASTGAARSLSNLSKI